MPGAAHVCACVSMNCAAPTSATRRKVSSVWDAVLLRSYACYGITLQRGAIFPCFGKQYCLTCCFETAAVPRMLSETRIALNTRCSVCCSLMTSTAVSECRLRAHLSLRRHALLLIATHAPLLRGAVFPALGCMCGSHACNGTPLLRGAIFPCFGTQFSRRYCLRATTHPCSGVKYSPAAERKTADAMRY